MAWSATEREREKEREKKSSKCIRLIDRCILQICSVRVCVRARVQCMHVDKCWTNKCRVTYHVCSIRWLLAHAGWRHVWITVCVLVCDCVSVWVHSCHSVCECTLAILLCKCLLWVVWKDCSPLLILCCICVCVCVGWKGVIHIIE